MTNDLSKRRARIVDTLLELCESYDSGLRTAHVAAVVHRSRIISMGFNSTKTSPRVLALSGNSDKTCIHAEMDALHRSHKTEGMDLFVMRRERNGKVGNSAPCKECTDAIRVAGIKNVVYSTNSGIAIVRAQDLAPRIRTRPTRR